MKRGLEYKKIFQALNFFAISETGRINKLKALKLIWLADRLHLRKYGRTITGDVYWALPHGPVPSNAKNFAEDSQFAEDVEKEYGYQYIRKIDTFNYESIKPVDSKVFSKSDITVLQEIYNAFGNLGQYTLRDLSHEYPEWLRFESALKMKRSSRYLIEMSDFFKNCDSNPEIFNQPDELLEVSKEDYFAIAL